MRQLLPTPLDEVDPIDAHAAASRPVPRGRPWVAINMVTSVDGATAVDGVSGGLGSEADKATFRAVRAVADVILVAAGTVRAESYGPPRPSPEVQRQRTARGQAAIPRMAIVSRSLDLDPEASVFARAADPPLVLTVDDVAPERLRRLEAVAEIHHVGGDVVDLPRALGLLRKLGYRVAIAEGGPSLNGQLIAEGLVDELNVTLSPQLVAGSSARLAVGDEGPATPLDLAHLWMEGPVLLARYVRASQPS